MSVYFAWVLAQPDCGQPAATGAAIRWMRENARLFDRDDEVGPLAASVPDAGGVVFVPAFTGLNVPYNDHNARGTILGLTLGSTRAHIVRAFLVALGFQLRAILDTIESDTGLHVDRLHLGGGVSASDEACQIQTDLLGIPTIRPVFHETTARAAALLAGLGAGTWCGVADLPPCPRGRPPSNRRFRRRPETPGLRPGSGRTNPHVGVLTPRWMKAVRTCGRGPLRFLWYMERSAFASANRLEHRD